jgi:hypothetical protein
MATTARVTSDLTLRVYRHAMRRDEASNETTTSACRQR